MTLPAGSYRPRYELAARVVEVLREDAALADPTHGTSLLFPSWSPVKASDLDLRVYEARADLAAGLAQVFPRLYVATTAEAPEVQQREVDLLTESVSFWVHALVPAQYARHGERIIQRVFEVLATATLSSPRIMASPASWEGVVVAAREAEMASAHRLTAGPWRCRFVGVRA